MSIRKSFESETIDANGVFLTDDEETELFIELQKLIQMQLMGEGDQARDVSAYTADDAQELAGLAFVAGRAYQASAQQGEGADSIVVELSKDAIEALLVRVITERLQGD